MPPKSPAEKAQALEEYRKELLVRRKEFPTILQTADCPRLDIKEFELLRKLGSGTFGIVFKARRGDQVVAIKAVDKRNLSLDQIQQSIMERKLLCALESPLICNIVAKCKDSVYLYMMLDSAEFGDLFAYLEATASLPSEAFNRGVLSQLVCGLEYVHACNFIYRDLKPENCLVYANGRVKLGDFGLAVMASANIVDTGGTVHYLAPEVYASELPTDASDWWSLGVMAYELSLFKLPFSEADDTYETVAKNVMGPLKGLDDANISEELKNFITLTLEKAPSKRLGSGPDGSGSIKRHAWFESVDWYNVIFEDFQFEVKIPEFQGEPVEDPLIFKNLDGEGHGPLDFEVNDF